MLFRLSSQNVSKIIRLNQQSVRYLSLTLPDQKIIQFKLSDIGEGTKEVVVKGMYILYVQIIIYYDFHLLGLRLFFVPCLNSRDFLETFVKMI